MSKFVLIFLIISLIASVLGVTRVTEEIKEECRQQTNLTKEESRVIKPNEVLSQNKKCFIKCLFEKGGYIESDGTILVDKMKSDEIADGDKERLKVVYACVSKLDKIKDCDKILELINCFTAQHVKN